MENRISTGLRPRFVWLRQLSRRTGEFAVVQIRVATAHSI